LQRNTQFHGIQCNAGKMPTPYDSKPLDASSSKHVV